MCEQFHSFKNFFPAFLAKHRHQEAREAGTHLTEWDHYIQSGSDGDSGQLRALFP
jgi:hypothetical protein